jgi:transposase
MPTSFRPYHPDQSYLLPPCPRDWLPDTHLALFVSDSLDELDLGAFYARYEGDGRRNQPFDPRMMVKVLVYGYSTGVVSSRQIARKIEEDVAFRYLAAGNFPAHRTICDFRLAHLGEFRELFVQVVRLAREAGLVKLGRVAVDGTKVGANASRHKAMSYGRMRKEDERLRREIDELLERAQVQDAAEDERYGPDVRGDELPEELRRREDRLRKIREAKARLEAQQAEQDRSKGRHPDDDRKSPRGGRRFARDFGVPPDKTQSNFTDPDSRIMLGHDGWKQAYNPQIAVDAHSHLIVATGLTQSAADVHELVPVLDALEQITGQRPHQVLADAGYRSEDSFRRLEQLGIDAVISLGQEGKKPPDPNSRLVATRRMAEKLESPEARQAYRTRKATAEPVIGWIKQVLGFRRFSLRGLRKVRAEWDLVCLAVDLRRMHRLARA